MQVAAAEKDIADSCWSADCRFFAAMQANAADIESGVAAAITGDSVFTVGMTVSRTKTTFLQHGGVINFGV